MLRKIRILAAAFCFIAVSLLFLPRKNQPIDIHEHYEVMKRFGHRGQILVYTVLFALALLTVLRIVT